MRRLELSAALVAAAVTLTASSVRAQRLGLELDAPDGEPERAEPAELEPADAEPASAEPANPEAPGATTEALDVPEPPGSHREREVLYPIPTPGSVEPDEPQIRISSRVTTRLRALDANLQALATRGGTNIVNAVLSLLTGGLAITLGAVRPNPVDEMSIYLYVYGGTAALRGVLDFALTPNAQGAAITYQHMPMTTREEVQERLAFGERALSGLAEQSLIARVLDASLNLAAGVAVVPIFAAKEFTISDPLDYFVLIGAGVSVVSGIITLASTSAAEQRWSAYQELRARLREERSEERRAQEAEVEDVEEVEAEESVSALDGYLLAPRFGPSVRFGLAGAPSGGFASVSLTF